MTLWFEPFTTEFSKVVQLFLQSYKYSLKQYIYLYKPVCVGQSAQYDWATVPSHRILVNQMEVSMNGQIFYDMQLLPKYLNYGNQKNAII